MIENSYDLSDTSYIVHVCIMIYLTCVLNYVKTRLLVFVFVLQEIKSCKIHEPQYCLAFICIYHL